MKESFQIRWDVKKKGLLTLRELDFVLINLKFDKLFFEKV